MAEQRSLLQPQIDELAPAGTLLIAGVPAAVEGLVLVWPQANAVRSAMISDQWVIGALLAILQERATVCGLLAIDWFATVLLLARGFFVESRSAHLSPLAQRL